MTMRPAKGYRQRLPKQSSIADREAPKFGKTIVVSDFGYSLQSRSGVRILAPNFSNASGSLGNGFFRWNTIVLSSIAASSSVRCVKV